MHRIENEEYNPTVLAGIIDRQQHYRQELCGSGFCDWAARLVGTDTAQVADCLVHFTDPKYKFEGRTIFKFLFGTIDFDEFQNNRSKWIKGFA
jgi:hypothetical protein